MLNLKCEKCLVSYEKPEDFNIWNEKFPSVFWRWSLKFCDKCRREKETESLEQLPKILETLSNDNQE